MCKRTPKEWKSRGWEPNCEFYSFGEGPMLVKKICKNMMKDVPVKKIPAHVFNLKDTSW